MYHSAAAPDPSTDRPSARDQRTATAEARRRKSHNRRVSFQRRAPIVAVAEGVSVAGRVLVSVARVLGKALLVLGLVGMLFFGGKLALAHVMDSPRFALREVTVSPTSRVSQDEVLALAAVEEGDRLLALDTDAIAARVAEHPWVAEARVSRQLPAGLKIDVTERKATAVALLGALYLLDDSGRPFKRATVAEADGLPVITGLERSQYVDYRQPSEAAYREALAIVAAWGKRPGRPPLGEVNLSPRYGFTVFLLDGGAEIRLGRGDYDRKLARLDQIFEAVEASGADGSAVRVVHLDGGNLSKISVGLQLPESPGLPAAGS